MKARRFLRKTMLRINWGVMMGPLMGLSVIYMQSNNWRYKLSTPSFAALAVLGLICLYAAFGAYDSALKKPGTYGKRVRGLKLKAALFYAPLTLLLTSSVWAPNPMACLLILLILAGPALVLFFLSTLRARLDALIEISGKKHAAETIGKKIYTDALSVGFMCYFFTFIIMAATALFVAR